MQSADHHVVSDVELPSLVEQGFFDVFLDDISFLCSVEVLLLLLQDGIEFIEFVNDCYSLSSVGQLTWFHNPNVSIGLFGQFFLGKATEFLSE